MASERVERSVDLTDRGADELLDFIHEFHRQEGQNQALLEIYSDDGTLYDKAELIAETDDDGDVTYIIRLSGL